MAGEACHRHKKSPQKIAAAISSRAVSSLAAAATRSRPPRLTAGAASSTMNAILALLLVCACAGCASAAPTLLLAACMMKERGVHMRVEELTEMIGVACNTLTDFDIQLVVDADMRRWVKKKLPQLCDRVDLATLNMTLNMKEGTLEHMREVRSFKVRAIEKYARIHASNGLIYLDTTCIFNPARKPTFSPCSKRCARRARLWPSAAQNVAYQKATRLPESRTRSANAKVGRCFYMARVGLNSRKRGRGS